MNAYPYPLYQGFHSSSTKVSRFDLWAVALSLVWALLCYGFLADWVMGQLPSARTAHLQAMDDLRVHVLLYTSVPLALLWLRFTEKDL